jgi:hypothetical protein
MIADAEGAATKQTKAASGVAENCRGVAESLGVVEGGQGAESFGGVGPGRPRGHRSCTSAFYLNTLVCRQD